WRRRLPPSPPKPRTGNEAGGAGSNRTSVPGRGHHTTALSWTQCQSFLDNIITGFQPNLSLNDRRNDDRTPHWDAMASVPLNAFSLQAEDRLFQFPFSAPGDRFENRGDRLVDLRSQAANGIGIRMGL